MFLTSLRVKGEAMIKNTRFIVLPTIFSVIASGILLLANPAYALKYLYIGRVQTGIAPASISINANNIISIVNSDSTTVQTFNTSLMLLSTGATNGINPKNIVNDNNNNSYVVTLTGLEKHNSTGALLWSIALIPNIPTKQMVVSNNGQYLYVFSGSYLYAINTSNGSVVNKILFASATYDVQSIVVGPDNTVWVQVIVGGTMSFPRYTADLSSTPVNPTGWQILNLTDVNIAGGGINAIRWVGNDLLISGYNNRIVRFKPPYNTSDYNSCVSSATTGPCIFPGIGTIEFDSNGTAILQLYDGLSGGDNTWIIPTASTMDEAYMGIQNGNSTFATDSNGYLYVLDFANNFILKYAPYCKTPRSFPATSSVVTVGTKILDSHFVNLMANINYLRQDAFLASCGWTQGTPPSVGRKIMATDINDLRACLAQVYQVCNSQCAGAAAPCTWNVAAGLGTKIRATDLNDLATGVANAP